MCIKHFYMCSDWGPLILQSGWSVYTKTLISLKTEIESERCEPSFCSYSWCLNGLNVIGYTWPPSLYKTFSTWWPTGDQLKYCIKQYHNNNFSLFCAVPLEPFMLTAPLSTYHHMWCDSKNLKYFFFPFQFIPRSFQKIDIMATKTAGESTHMLLISSEDFALTPSTESRFRE